jgi:glutamine cyclotransferase
MKKFIIYTIAFLIMSCSNEIESFDILIESDDKILNKQSEIKLALTLNGKVTNYDFESYLNKIKIENITKLSESKFGSNIIEVKFVHNDKERNISKSIDIYSGSSPKLFDYKVLNIYDHDISSYTQGLEFHNDILYESTGLNGFSSLKKIDLFNGNKILNTKFLDNEFFGEGLTIFDQRIIQLTWKNKVGFIYDLNSMNMIKSFNYNNSIEGWGLANDGEYIYKSDGTEKIWILDPETLQEISYIEIVTNNKKVKNINELEIVDDIIYANTYQFNKDVVLAINKNSGEVLGIINFQNLREKVKDHPDLDVLNGIAYYKKNNSFFMTGKKWNKIFEVEIIKN